MRRLYQNHRQYVHRKGHSKHYFLCFCKRRKSEKSVIQTSQAMPPIFAKKQGTNNFVFFFFLSIFPQLKIGSYKQDSAKSYCPVAVAGYSGYSVFPVPVRSHHIDKMQDMKLNTVEAFKQQTVPPLTNYMQLPKTVPQLHFQGKSLLNFQKVF